MTDHVAVRAVPERSRWPERVTLRDGSEVEIRPIRPTDKKRLRDGFARLSAESRQRRFLVPTPRLSARLVRYLTEVDHHDHEALGALGADTGEPVGIARYVRSDAAADAAEVAVAVVDEWQRRGVATALLRRLAERAREEGITRFTATCLADNDEALELLDELGAARTTTTESGLVEARIELPATDESALSRVLRTAAARRLAFTPLRTRAGGG
jgi:RimJ/RimL family protein N-acetyltransferase